MEYFHDPDMGVSKSGVPFVHTAKEASATGPSSDMVQQILRQTTTWTGVTLGSWCLVCCPLFLLRLKANGIQHPCWQFIKGHVWSPPTQHCLLRLGVLIFEDWCPNWGCIKMLANNHWMLANNQWGWGTQDDQHHRQSLSVSLFPYGGGKCSW